MNYSRPHRLKAIVLEDFSGQDFILVRCEDLNANAVLFWEFIERAGYSSLVKGQEVEVDVVGKEIPGKSRKFKVVCLHHPSKASATDVSGAFHNASDETSQVSVGGLFNPQRLKARLTNDYYGQEFTFVRCDELNADAILFFDVIQNAGCPPLKAGQEVVVDVVGKEIPGKGLQFKVLSLHTDLEVAARDILDFGSASKEIAQAPAVTFSDVSGKVSLPPNAPHAFIFCPKLNINAIVHPSVLKKAGLVSLEDGQNVVADIEGQHDQKKGMRYRVKKLKLQLAPPSDKPKSLSRIITTEASLDRSGPRYSFFIINSPTQLDCHGKQAFCHANTPGFRQHFMKDNQVLIQPGEKVIARIEMHGPAGTPVVLGLEPLDVGLAGQRTNAGLYRPAASRSHEPP